MSDDSPDAIAALVAAGDDRAAYARLVDRLGWPRGRDLAKPDVPRYVRLLGELANRRESNELADLAETVVRDPDSPDRLYDLGYALIDAGAPAIAASILWHCLALVGDSEEVVCELVSALESALAYPDALAILGEHAALRARSFLCQYLYAFNAAMSGHLELTRATYRELLPSSEDEEALRDTIAAIVARADRVAEVSPLDERDLRGWHYVLTGGLVQHQSPFGFAEPMHGRYAYLADSFERVAFGLDRLATLLRGREIPCVYAPPGRSHEIVAHAAAARLGVSVMPWPAVGVPAPGLVVVYDLAELEATELGRLVQRRPEQILYAHACPWTSDCPVAPDITTVLYQTLVPPWGEPMIVDPETRAIATGEPDERSIEELAAAITGTLAPEDLAADEPVKWARLVERVWPLPPAQRSRLWAGGPVPSSRFA
jgi:hypothetical protein